MDHRASLPDVVASHFGGSGRADGFVPRGAYPGVMLAVTVGVPTLIVVLQAVVLRTSPVTNLPNRDYWLAPERKEATFAFLDVQAMRFAVMMVAFLCFVHWLLVKANAAQPPQLGSSLFVPIPVAFLLASLAWAAAFALRFRRRARISMMFALPTKRLASVMTRE